MTSPHDSDLNPYAAPSEASESADQVQTKPVTPFWGWLFFAACLAIMVATRGGVIWGALGGAMGGLCLKISQNHKLAVFTRLIFCTVITTVLWSVILLLVMKLT
jgi:hypothetical protein